MEMTNWKTVHKRQSWGERDFGIEIRVAIDRELTEKDSSEMYSLADQIEQAIMTETMRLDPEEQKIQEEERELLLKCFDDTILTEKIPNGYCSRWCCTMRPWYKVTTRKGRITLGWRKRVIEISWEPEVGSKADDLFPAEDVTKSDRLIHAWGYEKAKQYISRLLQP